MDLTHLDFGVDSSATLSFLADDFSDGAVTRNWRRRHPRQEFQAPPRQEVQAPPRHQVQAPAPAPVPPASAEPPVPPASAAPLAEAAPRAAPSFGRFAAASSSGSPSPLAAALDYLTMAVSHLASVALPAALAEEVASEDPYLLAETAEDEEEEEECDEESLGNSLRHADWQIFKSRQGRPRGGRKSREKLEQKGKGKCKCYGKSSGKSIAQPIVICPPRPKVSGPPRRPAVVGAPIGAPRQAVSDGPRVVPPPNRS